MFAHSKSRWRYSVVEETWIHVAVVIEGLGPFSPINILTLWLTQHLRATAGLFARGCPESPGKGMGWSGHTTLGNKEIQPVR